MNNQQTEFTFESTISVDRTFFTVKEAADILGCCVNHVHNLIDDGTLKLGIDLKREDAKKSMRRIPRNSVINLLKQRQIS